MRPELCVIYNSVLEKFMKMKQEEDARKAQNGEEDIDTDCDYNDYEPYDVE